MSADLSTRYLGLDLANPVVASPSPLTGDLDTLRQLEAAGAAAVILPSVFEEEIEHDASLLHELDVHGSDEWLLEACAPERSQRPARRREQPKRAMGARGRYSM